MMISTHSHQLHATNVSERSWHPPTSQNGWHLAQCDVKNAYPNLTITYVSTRIIRACKMLGNSCRGLERRNRPLACKSAVLSVSSYGLPLYKLQRHLKHISRVQNFATRWIFGGMKGSPIGAVGHTAALHMGKPTHQWIHLPNCQPPG